MEITNHVMYQAYKATYTYLSHTNLGFTFNFLLDTDADVGWDVVLHTPVFATSQDVTTRSDTVPTGSEQGSSIQTYDQQAVGGSGYENYVALFKDEDWFNEDEDPAFLAAVEASLADQQTGGQSVNTILKLFQDDNLQQTSDESESINILINRKAVLKSTLRAIERKTFSFLRPVCITFAGEEAVDVGGPRREFFRLLMASLSGSAVFHGSWFSHDLHQLSNRKYALTGKLVAWSILQGCNGPRCLSEVGYNLCKGVRVESATAIKEIANGEMKEILQALETATSEEAFVGITKKYADNIAQYGYSKIYTATLASKDEIVDSLLKQYFVYGVNAEYMQFIEGMNSIGNFGNIVQANKAVFDAILSNKCEKLTASSFMSLYELDRSEKGSNRREQEDNTIYCLELFLKDLEEGEVDSLTLEDLLVFITGADSVPPLGFDQLITVDFFDFEAKVRRRPWSSTCALTLHLPRGVDEPEEFNALMVESLLGCHGFGKI